MTHVPTQVKFTGERSKTKQNFKKECDVNHILERFHRTGLLPNMVKKNPKYGDFSSLPDYRESLDKVSKAKEQFDALTIKMKRKFKNIEGFLEYVNDKNNEKELQDLGILNKPAVVEPAAPPAPPNAPEGGK